MKLPEFKYNHLETSFMVSERKQVCQCCGKQTDIIYIGPIYCINPPEVICPQCIYDFSCAEKYNAYFIDPDYLDKKISADKLKQLCYGTPGFYAQSNEYWKSHCGDFCEFIGAYENWSDIEWDVQETLMESLRERNLNFHHLLRDREVLLQVGELSYTLYLFKCLTCGKLIAYVESRAKQAMSNKEYAVFSYMARTRKMLPPIHYNLEKMTALEAREGKTTKEWRDTCICCKRKGAELYKGPVYGNVEPTICFDCVYSGWAAKKLRCQFTEGEKCGKTSRPEEIEWITHRTPGIDSEHSIGWMSHCGKMCQLVKMVWWGSELFDMGVYDEVLAYISADENLKKEFEGLYDEKHDILNFTNGENEYGFGIFRCTVCGKIMVAIDSRARGYDEEDWDT